MTDYRGLLISKGFSLNEYPEGKFWELEITSDEAMKKQICRIFGAEVDFVDSYVDIDTIILQCTEDYDKCLFYYDCNDFDMSRQEFMDCVSKINTPIEG